MLEGIFMSNRGVVGDRVRDFASIMLRYQPTGNTTLLGLTSGMRNEQTVDVKFEWFEDGHISGRTAITAAATATAQTVTVEDSTLYIPGKMLLVEETGEIMRVIGVTGSNLEVTRGWGGTATSALTTAMNLVTVGNAFEEGSTRPTSQMQQGSPRTNLVQIFRTNWSITGTAKAVKYRMGNKRAEVRTQAVSQHAEDMERAFMWGVRSATNLNGSPFTTTDGMVTQIRNNGGLVVAAASEGTAGQLHMVDFRSFLREIFETQIKGEPNERLSLCGNSVLEVINRMVELESTYNIKVDENKYGIKVSKVMTPFGDLSLVTHPLMNESPLWREELYVMHPAGISKRTLRPTFDTAYDEKSQSSNGLDAESGDIVTEAGLQVKGAKCMGIYTGIKKAIKSPVN